MAISNTVTQALKFINHRDFENALLYTAISLDATSKKELRSGLSQSVRNKKFVDLNQDFIYRFSTGGFVSLGPEASLNYPSGTLGQTLYKLIRCNLLHEATLPNGFVFLEGAGLGGMRTDKDINTATGFGISSELLISLNLLVITSPSNSQEKLIDSLTINLYGLSIDINTIWGDRSALQNYPIWS